MKINIKVNSLIYDGVRIDKGAVMEVDEGTAFKLIRLGYAEEIINTEVIEAPKVRKAVRKSTKKANA